MAKLYFYYAAMNAGKSTTLLQDDFIFDRWWSSEARQLSLAIPRS